MDKIRKLSLAAIIIGIASQLYINFYISNFNFSFGAVLFPVFIYLYDDINPLHFGVASGIAFFILRYISGQPTIYILPEMAFYLLYGLIFFIAYRFRNSYRLSQLFMLMVICDFMGNMLEMYLRIGESAVNPVIFKGFAVAAITRASIAIVLMISHKYYSIFLIREEHEQRYRKLLWFTSQLKTEVYWMEKNMDHIEKVMTNAYQLFLNISEDIKKESWGNQALGISTDIHEIKKEYDIVVRGIESIMDYSVADPGMNFSELIQLLKESMKSQIKSQGKDISLEFIWQENFYTLNHYHMMSIFRNIINNAIEAIDQKGEIVFLHRKDLNEHYFEIKDNGCGISKEDKPHIFSVGFSSKINYSTGEINRGLGLSLVKNIVESELDGSIEVTSEENKGTCFEIRIPIHCLEGATE
ncbi:MAG: ATP-binding protein [Proteocatella sp.]